MTSKLFEQIRREQASGRIFTLKDWLALHPPPESAFTQTLATVAGRVRAGESMRLAIAEFLDEFQLRPSADSKKSALADVPEGTGDEHIDAYLGAVAEHLAAQVGKDAPEWSLAPARFLDHFWFVNLRPGFRALAIAESPTAFRRRGIFISAGSLVRV